MKKYLGEGGYLGEKVSGRTMCLLLEIMPEEDKEHDEIKQY